MDKLDIQPGHGSTDAELLFSVQVIDKQRLDQSTQTQMLQEVKLMKLVQHPNVVRLYEVRFCSKSFFKYWPRHGLYVQEVLTHFI